MKISVFCKMRRLLIDSLWTLLLFQFGLTTFASSEASKFAEINFIIIGTNGLITMLTYIIDKRFLLDRIVFLLKKDTLHYQLFGDVKIVMLH